jgi:hypothetical protein
LVLFYQSPIYQTFKNKTMKKITLTAFFALFALLLASCGSNSAKPESSSSDNGSSSSSVSKETGDATGDKESTESSSDCDMFLSEYEDFATDYVDMLKKYSADPTNTSMVSEMTQYSQKVQNWSERWKKLGTGCVSDPNFSKKYLEITERFTKAAASMYNQ